MLCHPSNVHFHHTVDSCNVFPTTWLDYLRTCSPLHRPCFLLSASNPWTKQRYWGRSLPRWQGTPLVGDVSLRTPQRPWTLPSDLHCKLRCFQSTFVHSGFHSGSDLQHHLACLISSWNVLLVWPRSRCGIPLSHEVQEGAWSSSPWLQAEALHRQALRCLKW